MFSYKTRIIKPEGEINGKTRIAVTMKSLTHHEKVHRMILCSLCEFGFCFFFVCVGGESDAFTRKSAELECDDWEL